jgi:hypothetical protein
VLMAPRKVSSSPTQNFTHVGIVINLILWSASILAAIVPVEAPYGSAENHASYVGRPATPKSASGLALTLATGYTSN